MEVCGHLGVSPRVFDTDSLGFFCCTKLPPGADCAGTQSQRVSAEGERAEWMPKCPLPGQSRPLIRWRVQGCRWAKGKWGGTWQARPLCPRHRPGQRFNGCSGGSQVNRPGRASFVKGTPKALWAGSPTSVTDPWSWGPFWGSKKCPCAARPGTAGRVSLFFFFEAPKCWCVGDLAAQRRAIFWTTPIFERAPGQHVNQRWHPSCSAPRIIFGDPASPPKIRGEFFLLFSLFIFSPIHHSTAWLFSTHLTEPGLPFLPTPPSRPRNLSTSNTTTRPKTTKPPNSTTISHQPCRARLRTRPPLSLWRPCRPRPASPPPPSLPRPSTSRRPPLSMSTSSSASAIR